MEKNFIVLHTHYEPAEEGYKSRLNSCNLDMIEVMRREKYSSVDFKCENNVDVEKLYDTYPKGVIYGLPGSGKTTILKYIAFREFQKKITDERLILFIYCDKFKPLNTGKN